MAFVRATLAVTAALTIPQALLPPPLESGPPPGKPVYVRQNMYSQVGLAGKELYQQQCAQCHGDDAKGTLLGPSLGHPAYQGGRLSRQDFHRAVSEGVRARRWTFGDMPANEQLSFNDIELIARYVREVQNPRAFR